MKKKIFQFFFVLMPMKKETVVRDEIKELSNVGSFPKNWTKETTLKIN